MTYIYICVYYARPPRRRIANQEVVLFLSIETVAATTNTDKSTEGLSERHLLAETLALFPASNSSVASICTRVALSPSIYEASEQSTK